MIRRIRALALAAVAAPLIAACQDVLDNEVIGPTPRPADARFNRYAVIGTSLGAGVQSAGINDSTQRQSYAYQLALAMGLIPGANWFYPSLTMPGCVAPYTNPLTGARVGGASASACAYRAPGSIREYMSNTSIPSIRVQQVLNVADTSGPLEVLSATQFITGNENPIDMVERQNPTFISVEIGANDILGAAGAGDTNRLTSLANFTAALTTLANRLDATGASVAIANIPTNIPHFTRGQVFFCLKTGLCPGIPANPAFTNMAVDASCAPTPPAVGATYMLPFPATAMIMGVLAGGGAAAMNCATDVVTVTTGAGTAPVSPTISAAEYATIFTRLAAFNTAIENLAAARGYALADLDSAFTSAANAAVIPPFPDFVGTPGNVSFGPLFSLDGLHFTRAGGRVVAVTFANAINAEFGTTLTVP